MKQEWRELLSRAVFVVAVGFVCFVFGFFTPLVHNFPYSLMAKVVEELPRLGMDTDVFHSDMYVAAAPGATGVVRYDPERAYSGYTLFTSANSLTAFLIDMKGDVVHTWNLPYDRIWKSSAIEYPDVPLSLMWHGVHLYPNGDLLAVYEGCGDQFYGYALARIDRNSDPVWTYLDHVHHDVSVGADGTIYTLTESKRAAPIAGLERIKTPYTEDFVVVLSADGKLIKKISLIDAFANSPYRGMLKLLKFPPVDDMLHTNAVTPLPPGFAKSFPRLPANCVLVSNRNLDAVALLDLDSKKIVWALRGPWARQHDARPLPNGDIILFDDMGDVSRGDRSRVLEFQPNPFKLVWEFPGDSGESLSSEIYGANQKLPNGNVLITDSGTARLLEVTPDKKVVWEYRSPFLQGDHHQWIGVLNSGHRYAPGDLHFQFNHPASSAKLQTAQGEGKP